MADQPQDSSEGKTGNSHQRPPGHIILPEWLLQSNALGEGGGLARESSPALSKGVEVIGPEPSEGDLLHRVSREL